MMQIFLLALLLAVCDGQVTTNHKTMPAGSSCIPDHPVHKEVKILKEQVLRTDAKLQEMKETYQSQHESLKADLDALRNGQHAVTTEMDNLRVQLQPLFTTSTAQDCTVNELWVSAVSGFSSEYGGCWTASKVIGPSDVYPSYGDICNTWASKPRISNDYIELEFESALYITEVLIYETYHGGAVKKVEFRNPQGNWDVKATYTPTDITASRIFTVDIQSSTYRTNQVKLTLDCTVASSWVEIDAVKIKGTKNACA